ncbi:MAG TPA: hypothetical protein VLJ68_10825 [Chitinophagaceae bacterium]|nr:hypothetical protein [Chitinophagaceae bacterium]
MLRRSGYAKAQHKAPDKSEQALVVGCNARQFTHFKTHMTIDKIDSFDEKAELLFRNLISDYGYTLEGKNLFELNGMKWSTKHVYINSDTHLKIEIQQAPYYTDYGFSIFIYNLRTDEYNILYNIPHDSHDEEDKFLVRAHQTLFSSSEAIDLISGKYWRKLSHILFQE